MQIFKSNTAALQEDNNAPPLLHKHFPAATYSWLRSNCEVRKMGVLAVFFTSDPDPSQESGGLTVTPPRQVLQQTEGLLFISSIIFPLFSYICCISCGPWRHSFHVRLCAPE